MQANINKPNKLQSNQQEKMKSNKNVCNNSDFEFISQQTNHKKFHFFQKMCH